MDFPAWGTLLTNWPFDWISIGACAALLAFDAMRTGPARAAALALSLPVTLLLIEKLPSALFLGTISAQLTAPLAQLGIFAAMAILLYLTIHRLIFTFSDGLGPIQALLTGLAATVVVVLVWLQVPNSDTVWNFGPQVEMVFGVAYRFWWLLASYIALATVRS